MIIRPAGLEIVKASIEFNYRAFEYLEIDLEHVNRGKRSSYSADEVVKIVMSMINNLRLVPSGEKDFGNENCSYFVRSGSSNDKKFKLVFCICSDRPTTIGVVTLHRI